jgi:Mg2+/Co2+ transporter CorC
MTDIPSIRVRVENGADEAKSRRSLKNLFRLWRRRGGETDIRDAIEELIEENEDADPGEALENSESNLLLNVLKFGDLTAYDVMVPRADIKAVADDANSAIPACRSMARTSTTSSASSTSRTCCLRSSSRRSSS